jgi:hypothetical protein
MKILSRKPREKNHFQIKIVDQNLNILVHSENFKSAKNYSLSYFQSPWVKNMRDLGENFM